MKIAIVAPSPVPFFVGGAEKLFLGLHYHMNKLTSHEVELIKVPCRDQEFWSLMEAYHRFSRLDLSHFEMVITTKYPAWMIHHKNHCLYMQHTCRGLYDLYHLNGRPNEFIPEDRRLSAITRMLENKAPDRSLLEPFFRELFRLRDAGLPSGTFSFPGPFTRAVVRWLDRIALSTSEIKSYSAISKNVARREGYFPEGVEVEIIHHPSSLDGLHSSGYNHIFTASRLEELKRTDMLIKAFMSTSADIELRIAGTGGQQERFRKLAGKDRRIRFLGFITDEGLIKEYADALFVPFVPYDEDYGLITVEAMQSSKAVLATEDSGGVKELIVDGVNGIIVPPRVDDLARALDRLINDRENTIKMGIKGRDSVSHINWPNTISRLLRESDSKIKVFVPAKAKKKIVLTTTFEVYPPVSGGKKRIFHLYKEIAKTADVLLITLTSSDSPLKPVEIAPNLVEMAIPKSQRHLSYEGELSLSLKASIEDIASIDGCRFTPEFLDVLGRECKNADMAIASHPYLYNAIREVYGGRLLYDAHNVEYDMKNAVLPPSAERERHLEKVREVERACCLDSELVMAVSDEDALRLQELYGIKREKIVIVPNGMDFESAKANTLAPLERKALKERLGLNRSPVCLFVGSAHGPNIEALNVLKDIAGQCPEYIFLIVGSVCKHGEASAAPANMRLLGVLGEAEKIVVLNASDIGLNPVTGGSGSNLKLLEYIAYGIPVITTPFGLRGYALKDREHLLAADVKEFAAILKKQPLRDMKALQDMAQRSLALASSHYNWASIAARLSEKIGTMGRGECSGIIYTTS